MRQYMDIQVYLSGQEGTQHLKLCTNGNSKYFDSVQIMVSENNNDTNLGWFNIEQIIGVLTAIKVSQIEYLSNKDE